MKVLLHYQAVAVLHQLMRSRRVSKVRNFRLTCQWPTSRSNTMPVRQMAQAAAQTLELTTATEQHGRLLISTALAAVTPELIWRYSSVIRSTSARMMEAPAKNCGLMIPQTPQLGGWLIFTADLAAVTPENTWRYSSVIRSTSMRMMEAAAENCGLMIPQTPQLGG